MILQILVVAGRGMALLGFILLARALYLTWLASGGHAYAAQEQLTCLPLYVHSAERVEVSGGRLHLARDQYYRLHTRSRSQGGERHALRLDRALPEEFIASLIRENINVLADKANHLLVYQVSLVDAKGENEQRLMSYEDMRGLLQGKAESDAKNPLCWGLGLLLGGLGGFGMWQGRKQRLQAEQDAARSA